MTRWWAFPSWILLVATIAAPALTARAQEPTAQETAEARREFRRGMGHAQRERWDRAHESFARAYEIVGRPRILVNLAAAQSETGRLVEAAESYRRFLSEVTEGPDVRLRGPVEEELAALEPRIPKVRLVAEGLAGGDGVALDGEDVQRDAITEGVEVNPGSHELLVTRGGREVGRASFTVEEGDRREIRVDVPPPLPEPTLEPEGVEVVREDGDEGGGVVSSPWFWTGVGAAAVAATVTIVVVASSGDPERRTGNFGSGRWTVE